MLKGRLGLQTARVPQADRHGLLWLRRGNLFVVNGTLRFRTAGSDDLPPGEYDVPYQMLSAILLMPGTTISHDTMRILARHGTGLVVVGEAAVRLYASMPHGPDQSRRARHQVEVWSDAMGHRIFVARRMYAWRLGEVLPAADLTVLRGMEGARMKETYKQLASEYGIHWKGRRYDRTRPAWDDVPNQAINHASRAICSAAEVAVAVTGTIPQLGFIHEDSGIAFCLDIADLFRDSVTIPVAFGAAREIQKHADVEVERAVRQLAGRTIREQKLIPSMIDRIKELFDGSDADRHS